MILYLDASALVKLYIDEPGCGAVVKAVDRAFTVATARVTYAEARAAFARIDDHLRRAARRETLRAPALSA